MPPSKSSLPSKEKTVLIVRLFGALPGVGLPRRHKGSGVISRLQMTFRLLGLRCGNLNKLRDCFVALRAPPLDCICIMGSINSIYGTKLFNHLPNKELIKSMAPQKQNLYCEKDPTL